MLVWFSTTFKLLANSESLATFPSHRAIKSFMICFGFEYQPSDKFNSFKREQQKETQRSMENESQENKTKQK